MTDPRKRGLRELQRISGGTGEEIAARLERVSPTMANLLVDQGYGTVYSSPELSRQSREVATVAILAAAGYRSELRIHLAAALRVGLDLTELVALTEHISLYAGLPRMIEMAEILSEFLPSQASPFFGRPLSMKDHDTYVLDTEQDGPPLVLLHSIGTSRWAFRPLLTRLSSRVRGIAYDLRGHGVAWAPASTISMDSWIDDLVHLMDKMGFSKIHLVGLSLGGSVAQSFAERYPGRLHSLTLLSPPPPDPEKYASRARAIREEGPESQIGPTLARWFTPSFLGADPWEVRMCRESLRVIDPEVWAASFEALASLLPYDSIRRFPFPVRLIGGGSDQSVPSEMVRALSARIDGSQFLNVPGMPHQMTLETPEALFPFLPPF